MADRSFQDNEGQVGREGVPAATAAADLFAGAGEVRALCRDLDWSATPLGPVQTWPPALRVAVQMILASGIPNIILWGRDLTQIYNDPYADLIQGKHPGALGRGNLETWPEVAHINAPIYDRVFDGETVTIEDAHYPLERSGEVEDVYVTISFSPIRASDGAIGGVLATMIETTQDVAYRALQAERERLYRDLEVERSRLTTAFQQAPAFIAVLRGPEHEFEMANPLYRQLVGDRAVIGLPVGEALPEVVEQGFIDLLDDVYSSGQAYVGSEVPLHLKAEESAEMEQLFVNFVYQPLRDAEDRVEGILVHGVDVTDLVSARRTLKAQAVELEAQAEEAERARHLAEEAGRAAEEASHAKSDFLATMSHELRTPLNAIVGYTDLLLEGLPAPIPEAARAHVERIGISGRHLRELIEEVLTFSRLEAGEERLTSAPVDLQAVLDEVHALSEPLALSKGLEFHFDVARDLPRIESDAQKIRQILINLVGNAVKFTEDGSVAMDVTASADELTFRVRDTGSGIAADHLHLIFEPFWQAESGATRAAGGTGLGLGVTRRLARLLGGDVTVESRPREGSTFTVTLPTEAPTAPPAGAGGDEPKRA